VTINNGPPVPPALRERGRATRSRDQLRPLGVFNAPVTVTTRPPVSWPHQIGVPAESPGLSRRRPPPPDASTSAASRPTHTFTVTESESPSSPGPVHEFTRTRTDTHDTLVDNGARSIKVTATSPRTAIPVPGLRIRPARHHRLCSCYVSHSSGSAASSRFLVIVLTCSPMRGCMHCLTTASWRSGAG
jgi:hypothetical protein